MSAGSRTPRRPTPVARSTGVPVRSIVALGHGRDGGELVELAADHLGDERFAGEVGGEVLADELAVAQDRDAVGDLVDLVEEVADEEDRDAAGRGGRA